MSPVASAKSSGRSDGGRAAVRSSSTHGGGSRLSKRDRRALLLGLVVLVPALLYTTVLKPYRAAVDAARGRVDTQRELLARERGLLAVSDRVPEVIRAVIPDIQRLRERLLPTADPALAEAELTTYLEGLATDNRVLLQEMRALRGASEGPVAFTSMSVEPMLAEPEPGPLDPIRVTISAESDFEGIASFLNGIDGGRPLIRVVELTLESTRPNARSGAGEVLSLSMIIEAYAPAAATAARTERN